MHAICVRREMNANFDNTVCGLGKVHGKWTCDQSERKMNFHGKDNHIRTTQVHLKVRDSTFCNKITPGLEQSKIRLSSGIFDKT